MLHFLERESCEEIIHQYHRPYLASLGPVDGPLHGIATCRDFLAQILPWTPEARNQVLRCFERRGQLRTIFPDFPVWKFVLVRDALEGGLPHTVHDLIILPRQVVFMSSLENVLLHEKVHTVQKRRPHVFDRIYREWGWTEIDVQELPPLVLERHRMNPDTQRWWGMVRDTLTYVPLALLPSEARSLRQVSYVFSVFSAKTFVGFLPVMKCPWFVQEYGADMACNHPDEICAVLFTQLMLGTSDDASSSF